MLSWACEFRRSAFEAQARAESREARAASRTSLTVSGWPRPGRDNPVPTQAAANLNLKARRPGPPSAPPGSGNATESVKSDLTSKALLPRVKIKLRVRVRVRFKLPAAGTAVTARATSSLSHCHGGQGRGADERPHRLAPDMSRIMMIRARDPDHDEARPASPSPSPSLPPPLAPDQAQPDLPGTSESQAPTAMALQVSCPWLRRPGAPPPPPIDAPTPSRRLRTAA